MKIKTFAQTLMVGAALGLPLTGAVALARTPAAAPAVRPVEIPNTEQFDLTAPNHQVYRIFVAKPTGDAPPEGFPVIYMTDGNSVFAGAVDATRLQARALGPVVIVAIGYPIETPFDGPRRFYDLTPLTDPSNIPAHMNKDMRTGGQDAFLDFITQQVRPVIEQRYKTDPKRQTLFGHSLGGQFVLHALFTRPELFQTYIAGSPSIWWNGRSLLKERDAFAHMTAERRGMPALKVIVGQDELAHIVVDSRLLVTSLPPIKTYYQEIEGESHVSMLPAAINSALRFALKPNS